MASSARASSPGLCFEPTAMSEQVVPKSSVPASTATFGWARDGPIRRSGGVLQLALLDLQDVLRRALGDPGARPRSPESRGAKPGPARGDPRPDHPGETRRHLPRRPGRRPFLAVSPAGRADRAKHPRVHATRCPEQGLRRHRAGSRDRLRRHARVRARDCRQPPLEGDADHAERRGRGRVDRARFHRAAPDRGRAVPPGGGAGRLASRRDPGRRRPATRRGVSDGDGGGLPAARPADGGAPPIRG